MLQYPAEKIEKNSVEIQPGIDIPPITTRDAQTQKLDT